MIRAKIICTIGPVSESYEMLKRMAGAGMNIARLNMSHGDHEWHHKGIRHIKTLNRQIPTPIAVLLDTQGPEIRTGSLSEDFDLKQGSVLTVNSGVRVMLRRPRSTLITTTSSAP
jgi:pyruvate kinase